MAFKKRKPKKEKKNTDPAPSSFKTDTPPNSEKTFTQQIFVMKTLLSRSCMHLYRRTSYRQSLGNTQQAFQPNAQHCMEGAQPRT
jgi:hypothetical protein